MAEQVPHPRLRPDQLDRVILELIGALPTPELRRQPSCPACPSRVLGPARLDAVAVAGLWVRGLWRGGLTGLTVLGSCWSPGGAGVEPGVRSLDLCWSEGVTRRGRNLTRCG